MARRDYQMKVSNEQDKLARRAVSSMTRYRKAIDSRNHDRGAAEGDLIDRLINVEKAKQLTETLVVPTNPKNKTDISSSILQRLDETKQAIKREKLRHGQLKAIPQRNIIQEASTAKPKRSPAIKKSITQSNVDGPPSNRISEPTSISAKSSSRRSLSGPKQSWEGGFKTASTEDSLPIEPDENVIVAERRDPLSATERKRTILAALKLKR